MTNALYRGFTNRIKSRLISEANQEHEGDSDDEEEQKELDVDDDSSDINNMAKRWGKKKGFKIYLETSSLFGTNVKNVFDEAIQSTYNNRMEKFKDYKEL